MDRFTGIMEKCFECTLEIKLPFSSFPGLHSITRDIFFQVLGDGLYALRVFNWGDVCSFTGVF
jgi:hypothetical protein